MKKTEYSGRTSSHSHKFDDWAEKEPNGAPCIQQKTIFDAQWTDCPVEVEAEVKQLWRDRELGNDYYYVSWDSEEDAEYYPIIDEFLKSKGVTKCLIHWWW